MQLFQVDRQLKLLFFIIVTVIACESPEVSLNPDYTGQTGQITDIEGNIYRTVGIGSQIWMAENLKVTKLNDGTSIPLIMSDSVWNYYPQIAYCWYDNDSIKGRIYGALYSYYAISSEKLCPVDWHVPGDHEWSTL